ncbi:hypothetical protein Dsin_005869 [Dipteronia sinensis]|uniref:Reverse transcriptase zinc-binding domain-containing protein n=1 Tax=Dipteronia sinensis TaxID=43782 RepID=A0AAE0AXL8_9ROSI|nr:hypothetical protein Dsin_005869 [Dipteronia sinensis]
MQPSMREQLGFLRRKLGKRLEQSLIRRGRALGWILELSHLRMRIDRFTFHQTYFPFRLLGCLPIHATVSSIVHGDSWSWPDVISIDLFEIRSPMPSYNPNSNVDDRVRWLPSSNGTYSASSALASLRTPHLIVPWFKLVLFPQNIPRMNFLLCVAIRGRFSTRDHIHKYDPMAVSTCALCNSHLEYHAHLFFECLFSRAIWTQFMNICGSPWNGLCWNAFTDWASTHWRGNSPAIVANKLCLGVAVYHIWRERNCRIFEGT